LKSLLHERFMYLYYTMIVMSLTTLLDKKSPLFSELCLQSATDNFVGLVWSCIYFTLYKII